MTSERRPGAAYGKHRTSQRAWRTTRVWARRNFPPTCGLCNGPIDLSLNYRDPMAWTLDHIIPINVGGTNRRDNLQPAHRSCNGAKGDGTKPGNNNGDRWQNAPSPTPQTHTTRGSNTSRYRSNYVPPDKRAGPDAKDRRTFVYNDTPTTTVIIGPEGEQHLRDWGDNTSTHWTPGQPWPPQLKPDPWTYQPIDWN